MKIRFLKSDPRAGRIVEVDTARGRQLVAAGAAEYFDERKRASVPQRVEAPDDAARVTLKRKGKRS
jgi:hypothetical protein